ncbi:hypothetical protein PENTCL1PPCAC_22981, partial [Pristionchus entomophagus]
LQVIDMSSVSKRRTTARSINASHADESGLNDSTNSNSMFEQRTHEKDRLQGLNTRLAEYIERVRQLESENDRLTVSIRDTEVIQKKEKNSLQDRYEVELARLRDALEMRTGEIAKLQVERDTAIADYAEIKKKSDRFEHDLKSALNNERKAQSALDDSIAEKNKLRKENDYLTKRNAELEIEIRKLNGQVESLKKNLEDESLLRAGLQSKLDAALEDLRFQTRNLRTQLEEETKKRQVEMTTVSRRIENEYEEKLAAMLEETRKKTIDNITRNKEKTVNDLRHQLDHVNNLLNEATEREKEMRIRVREVESESGSYSNTITALEKKLAEMDKRLSDEQSLRRSLIDDKDRQLEMYQRRVKDLNDEIARLMAECNELADAKVLLDSELRDYESLLMSEESRLNLSQRSSPQVTKTTVMRSEESSSRSGIKRRRLSDGEGGGATSASRGVRYSHYKAKIESSHKTPVKIVEAAESGEYIRLENEGDEDIKVAGWNLKSINDGKETMFRFHTKTVFPANSVITVYSKDSGAKNSPPSSYVMKNHNWPGGKHPMVILSNKEDDMMASMTTVIDEASLNGDSVDPNERCAIM